MRAQKGFTLIELMIIVAIIATLVALAIPTYSDFTTRSKVSEGMNLATAGQWAIVEYYTVTGDWPLDNTAAGLAQADEIVGEYVASVSALNNQVVVLFKADAGVGIADHSIIFQATDVKGAIQWICFSEQIDAKFLPQNCRGE